MNNRIVVEALHTGTRNDSKGYYKELILLYDDGSWEKIFRSNALCSRRYLSGVYFKGKTRSQVIAKLEELYYNNEIEGEFLN